MHIAWLCSFSRRMDNASSPSTDLPHPRWRDRRKAMKISARNQLKGKITEVKKGTTTAHVKIDIGGTIVTAAITNESVNTLQLIAGKTAYAVIKASDVMVAVD